MIASWPFSEKSAGVAEPGLISGGIYLLEPSKSCDYLQVPCSLEMRGLSATRRRPGCCVDRRFEGYFQDIGLPESLAQAAGDMPEPLVRPGGVPRP